MKSKSTFSIKHYPNGAYNKSIESKQNKNWCSECGMDDRDRKKNKIKVYRCIKCDRWTDEEAVKQKSPDVSTSSTAYHVLLDAVKVIANLSDEEFKPNVKNYCQIILNIVDALTEARKGA